MKKTMRLLALVLALVMLLAFAGCAGKTTTGDSAEPAQTTEQTNESTETSEKPELTIWFFPMGVADPYQAACQAVLDEYNAGDKWRSWAGLA